MDANGNDHWYSIGPKVELHEYQVLKMTPRGFWILLDHHFDLNGPIEGTVRKRWINSFSYRQFASLTKEEAMDCFLSRKAAQVRILRKQLERAEIAHRIAIERKNSNNF